MAFRLNIEPPQVDHFAVEKEAQEATYRAWRRRNSGLLFPYVEMKWESPADYERWDDAFSGKAVGIVPPMSILEREFVNTIIAVGVWTRQHRGFLDAGNEVVLQSFNGPGSTHHRGVGLVGFVHVLPGRYQRFVRKWDDDDDYDGHCGFCGYKYAEDEYPCRDCQRCGNCCEAQGSYPATCWEIQSDAHYAYSNPSTLHPELKDAVRDAA